MAQYITIKNIVIAIIVVSVFGSFAMLRGNGETEIQTLTIQPDEFLQQVSISGTVVPAQEVDLAFSQGGRVELVAVAVGDVVRAGAILSSVENADLRAEVLERQAAVRVAQARLDSLKAGAREEEIRVQEARVADARDAAREAEKALLDTIHDAYTKADDAVHNKADQIFENSRTENPHVIFITQHELALELQRISIEQKLEIWNVERDTAAVGDNLADLSERSRDYLAGIRAFLDIAAEAVNDLRASAERTPTEVDGYKTAVLAARTNVNTAIVALANAEKALQSAENAHTIAKRELVLKKSGATEEDIKEQEARIASAEANLASSIARLQKTRIIAPFSGVVTRVDAGVGESASSHAPLISLMSAETFQIESFVPEINLPLITLGDEARAVLDAYGDSQPFSPRVVSIDPAETIRDGVSTYRTKLQFEEQDARIKPGMTANIMITTDKRSDVIAVPQGIIEKRDGKTFVQVQGGGGFVAREVKTGGVSSRGTIEITEGLTAGEIVLIDGGAQ